MEWGGMEWIGDMVQSGIRCKYDLGARCDVD